MWLFKKRAPDVLAPLFEDPRVKPFQHFYPRYADKGRELLISRAEAHRTVCVTCGHGVFEREYRDYRAVRFKSHPEQTFYVCKGCHVELIPVQEPTETGPYR